MQSDAIMCAAFLSSPSVFEQAGGGEMYVVKGDIFNVLTLKIAILS